MAVFAEIDPLGTAISMAIDDATTAGARTDAQGHGTMVTTTAAATNNNHVTGLSKDRAASGEPDSFEPAHDIILINWTSYKVLIWLWSNASCLPYSSCQRLNPSSQL